MIIPEEVKQSVVEGVKERLIALAKLENIDVRGIRIKAYLKSLKQKPVFALFDMGSYKSNLSLKQLAKTEAVDLMYPVKAKYIRKIIKAFFRQAMESFKIRDLSRINLTMYLTKDEKPAIGIYLDKSPAQAFFLEEMIEQSAKLSEEINQQDLPSLDI